ncbi:MAG: hypothetical protein AAGI01_12075, partial [Myxococcota bacterium]
RPTSASAAWSKIKPMALTRPMAVMKEAVDLLYQSPRPLPPGFLSVHAPSASFMTAIGLVSAIGFILLHAALALVGRPFDVPLPISMGCIITAGAGLLMFLHEHDNGIGRIWRYGRPIIGRVMRVGEDEERKINGQHPTLIWYHFTLDGVDYIRHYESWKPVAETLRRGDDLDVLYLEDDPRRSMPFLGDEGIIETLD